MSRPRGPVRELRNRRPSALSRTRRRRAARPAVRFPRTASSHGRPPPRGRGTHSIAGARRERCRSLTPLHAPRDQKRAAGPMSRRQVNAAVVAELDGRRARVDHPEGRSGRCRGNGSLHPAFVGRFLSDRRRTWPPAPKQLEPKLPADEQGWARPSGGGERDSVSAPDEQLGTQIVLEQPHMPADRAR